MDVPQILQLDFILIQLILSFVYGQQKYRVQNRISKFEYVYMNVCMYVCMYTVPICGRKEKEKASTQRTMILTGNNFYL